MSNTLIINAHPDFQNEASYSKKLQKMFEEKFNLTFPEEDFDVLNLYETEIPKIENGGLLTVWEKQLSNLTLTTEEHKLFEQSETLLSQFMAHHRIVIVSPLHNFNITSRLKDYMDNILIARKTFRYTEEGSEGLMTDDYKVFLLQASGSIYTNSDRYTPLEFSHYYLKEMFENMMAFDQFYIARAQGTAVQPVDAQKILQEARQEIDTIFPKFYSKG